MSMDAAFEVTKIRSIKTLNAGTRWITFDRSVDAQPGQFVMVWLPGIGEKPFSIAAVDPFSLLVVDVGPFSHAVHVLAVGDRVWIKGPLGKGFRIEGKRLLLVGGGYGSAPLLALARAAREQDRHVHVCLGARSEEGLLLRDDFLESGCQVSLATEDGSQGMKGLVLKVVEKAIEGDPFDGVYACGPTGMLSALAVLCKRHKIDYQLSWEAHMRCGMGLCGSCEVPIKLDPALPSGWLACFDGPVFIKAWDSQGE